MTNEIKEIKVNKTNKSITFINKGIGFSQLGIADEILDLITNLQEENEGWSKIFDTFSRRPFAHKYLEEKKKELKNDNIVGLDSEMIYKDYYNLKERIDKAVKYIENDIDLTGINGFEKLLQILRGDE